MKSWIISDNIKKYTHSAYIFLLDLIFPQYCLNCGREGWSLCPDCEKALGVWRPSYCLFCRKPTDEARLCVPCSRNTYLDRAFISSDYNHPLVSETLKKFKYGFIRSFADPWSKVMSDRISSSISPDIKECLLIVPVPLHPVRKRWRGFNQSELMAERIAENLGITIAKDGLKRIRPTPPQAGSNRNQRLNNLNGAFQWIGQDLSQKTIILVDDVATTGATLDNCAKELKKNQAQEVWALVAAHG